MSAYRIGIDVGGTFTDVVARRPDGTLVVEKAPTTPDDQSRGVVDAIARIAEAEHLAVADLLARTEAIVHGTTTGDNTMIQMSGAPTGLLVTRGFRDEIEMRRCFKEDIWDPTLEAPHPIAKRRVRLEVSQRMNAEGEVIDDLDEAEVRAAVRRLQAFGVTSIAVTYLHAYINPAHELRTRELILEEYPDVAMISLSHEVMPKPPEFERTSTTLVNAYVGPVIARYLDRLVNGLHGAGYSNDLLIATSAGGITTPEALQSKAVATIGSGPTGGATAAARARSRGRPRRRRQRRHGRHVLRRVPDPQGPPGDHDRLELAPPLLHRPADGRHPLDRGRRRVDLLVGRRQAAGRAALGRLAAGPHLLPTGRHRADRHRRRPRPRAPVARRVLRRPHDPRPRGRARRPGQAGGRDRHGPGARAVGGRGGGRRGDRDRRRPHDRRHPPRAVARGRRPRDLDLVAFGGMGAVHATSQAAALGMRHVLVPRAAAAFSAMGLLTADHVVDLSQGSISPWQQADHARIAAMADDLEAKARAELALSKLPAERLRFEWYCNLVYPGQTFDVAIPCDRPSADPAFLQAAVAEFHRRYEEARLIEARAQEPVFRGVRLVASGLVDQPEPVRLESATSALDPVGRRRLYAGGVWTDGAPVHDGEAWRPGPELVGPAVVQFRFTTLVLRPGDRARVLPGGDVLVDVARI